MAKGALRIALDDLLETNPVSTRVKGYWQMAKDRLDEVSAAFVNITLLRLPIVIAQSPALLLAVLVFVLTGWRWPFDGYVKGTLGLVVLDVSGMLAPFMRNATSDPALAELLEVMGELWVDPVLNVLEVGAGRDDVDPKEMARRFLGVITRINTVSELADMSLEFVTAGQMESKGRGNENMAAAMGLGFLGWQIFAPLLESGLQPGMERYYRRLYRPNRFSAGELRDLFALGRISPTELRTEAATLGWRDADVEHWIALAFRNLNEGDVWALYNSGDLTQAQVIARLSALGYSATDIPLLFKANPKKDVKDTPDVTRTTARAAFRDGLISEAELKDALVALDLSVREADLIVAIERRNVAEAEQRLSVSQVKAAWQENVLADTEAKFWLGKAEIPADQQAILIATWRAEMEPAFRKLNRGTIIGAYVSGILNRTQAQAKLIAVGYTQPDAGLELDLAEVQNPQAFGRPSAKPSRLLTPGNLTDLVVASLITPVDMQARLMAAGFTESDALLLSELARLEAAGIRKPLSQATVERAYLSHVLTRDLAMARLTELGIDEQSATIVLNTVERENPAEFGAAPEAEPRKLPLGVIAAAVLSGLLTDTEYQLRAVELGYLAEDAALVLAVARQEQATRPRQAGQGTIERAYVLQVLDRTQAAAKLVEIGFSPEDTETILQSVERDNPAVFAPSTVQAVRQPGPGALVEAFRNEIITELEYFARMLEIGYAQSAAAIYLSLATVAERKSLKRLSDAKILDLYGRHIFTNGETLARLTQSGYNDVDAGLLMRLERSGVEDSQVWNDFLAGLITVGDMIQGLLNLGFTQVEIDNAISNIS